MTKQKKIEGFSKHSRNEKIKLIADKLKNPLAFISDAELHLYPTDDIQRKYESFSENTLTNFFLPFGIAPNFLVNQKIVHVPMVTDESSVVAAASSAAKFWFQWGGFRCKVLDVIKTGQVHFEWFGNPQKLQDFFNSSQELIIKELKPFTEKMTSRGGGILNISLHHLPVILDGYYQIDVSFNTADAMGANFINSCLENLGRIWAGMIINNPEFSDTESSCNILMAILSNYNPDCLVECEVHTKVDHLNTISNGLAANRFAERFIKAVHIAERDVNRAVTHNKGILNGIDAVLIATGNDFRAVEACAHAWAARDGQYRSLSHAVIEEEEFVFKLQIPLSIGTIGGLTNMHPMAAHALSILGHPSAEDLMKITASVGLANNFSAIRALVSTGIQKGHMKMHLPNILERLLASDVEKEMVADWFKDKEVSHFAVEGYLSILRKNDPA